MDTLLAICMATLLVEKISVHVPLSSRTQATRSSHWRAGEKRCFSASTMFTCPKLLDVILKLNFPDLPLAFVKSLLAMVVLMKPMQRTLIRHML